jgi:hypothetical protein
MWLIIQDNLSFLERPKPTNQNYVRFEVLKATIMNMAAFWDVAHCRLLDFSDVRKELTASITVIS